MLQVLTILLLFLPNETQTAEQWLRRWKTDQQEASITMARMRLTEDASFDLDGAFGPVQMEIISDVVVQRGQGAAERTPVEIRTGGRVVNPSERSRRRRYESPLRSDLQVEADRLIFPYWLLSQLRPVGDVDFDRERGRDLVRITTVSREDDLPVERVTWIFDKGSGHLVQARAIITGPDRGTLLADVQYGRHDGLDVAVTRELNGSFAIRRRTRTFTILLKAKGEFVVETIETL